MKILDLPVERRDKLGSANSRRCRRAGRIPCILYGSRQENVPLATPAEAFGEVLKAHSVLVRLTLGDKTQTALVREVAWDTFGDHVEHIDFVRVEMSDEVKISVPLQFFGDPKGAHEGGVMAVEKPNLEVFARVDSIPEGIRVDVSQLGVGDGVHVGEVDYPANVRPARGEGELVVHIVIPRKSMEAAPEAVEGEEAAATAAAEAGGEEPAAGEQAGGERAGGRS